MFLSKQELKSVPFQIIHEKGVLAANKVKFDLQELEEIHYEKAVKEKAKLYGCTLEEARALSPFTPVDEVLVQEKSAQARADAIGDAIAQLNLKSMSSWLMPQLAAYISTFKLPMLDGKVDIREFLKVNFAVDDWHKGLYSVLMLRTRGSILPTQTARENLPYCALVPLILMPFKKFHGVPYSAWDTKDISLVVDYSLLQGMQFRSERIFTKEDLLLDRDKCLTVSSGAKAGTIRNPSTWHKLYNTTGTLFEGMPWLAQVMVSQIWVAHPSNRNNYMVLDWNNWDSMPEPLIDKEVVTVSKEKLSAPTLPWDI